MREWRRLLCRHIQKTRAEGSVGGRTSTQKLLMVLVKTKAGGGGPALCNRLTPCFCWHGCLRVPGSTQTEEPGCPTTTHIWAVPALEGSRWICIFQSSSARVCIQLASHARACIMHVDPGCQLGQIMHVDSGCQLGRIMHVLITRAHALCMQVI